MKQANINRLERIIKHLKTIDDTFDSLINYQDYDEYIEQGGITLKVSYILRESQKEAIALRQYLEHKLKVIKETNKTNKK